MTAEEERDYEEMAKRHEAAEHRAAALEVERDKNREWALAAEAEVRKLKQEHVEQGAKRDALEAECRELRLEVKRLEVYDPMYDPLDVALTPPEAQAGPALVELPTTPEERREIAGILGVPEEQIHKPDIVPPEAQGRDLPDCFRNDWDRARWERAGEQPQGGAGEGKP